MIFRAKLPDKPQESTRIGQWKSQRRSYKTLPDDLFNEITISILSINNIKTNVPLLPENSSYVFAVCKNKPIDTEILKWEEISGDIKHCNALCINNHKKRQRHEKRGSGKLQKRINRMKYIKRKRRENAKKKLQTGEDL